MAQKLSDAVSLEGEVPEPGSSVGIMESIGFGKAVAMLGVAAFAGLAAARFLFNFGKSTVTNADSEGFGTLGDW